METQHPVNESPLQLLARCGGYYSCRKDSMGRRLSPLVGYAGKYNSGPGGEKKQWVGDVYANFAKLEEHGPMLRHVARELLDKTESIDASLFDATGFCGAPMGGLALAATLATQSQKQYIFPEKKITALATADSREESLLVFDRHEPQEYGRYIIVEDVCNNFSTTADLVALIEKFGACVVAVMCFLNRSLEHDNEFQPRERLVLPIIACKRKKIMQYRQDDPFVKDDVEAGNVCWKPKKKDEWVRLMR